MNSNCESCDVELSCAYPYKPCDCCNYRKFVPRQPPKQSAVVLQFKMKEKEADRG